MTSTLSGKKGSAESWTKRFRPSVELLENRDCPSSAALFALNQQFSFYMPSNDYLENWSESLNEKWIRSANENSEWFYVLPNGDLYRWNSSFALSTKVDSVGTEVWNSPALLHDATPTTGASTALFEMDQRFDFCFTGNYSENWSGSLNEKWIRSAQDNNKWYYVLPTGELFQWNSSFANSVQAAVVDATVYNDPGLLYKAQPPADLLTELDHTYGFYFTGNYSENWSGSRHEKWIRAANDNDNWYYLLPSGQLHRWRSSFSNSPLIANVGTTVWDNPALLHDINKTPDSQKASINLFITDQTFNFVDLTGSNANFFNWSGRLSEKWVLSARDNTWYFLLPNGDMFRWTGNFNTSPFVAKLGREAYLDPNMLEIAQPRADVLKELDAVYGFYFTGDYQQNWSGLHNEKWIRAANDGDTFYFLLPNGELYRWTGSFDTSMYIGFVGTSVWNNPALLHNA